MDDEEQIAMPASMMPPKLLIRFCKLQKSFWHRFMQEVIEHYSDELGEEDTNGKDTHTPEKIHEPEIPNAPEKARSSSRHPNTETVPEAARKLDFSEPVVAEPAPVEKKKRVVKKKEKEPVTEEGEIPVPVEKKKRIVKKKEKEPVTEEGENPEETEAAPVEKKKRGPSEYNKFISSEVERLRKEDPDLNHKVAFKMAVAAWKERVPTPTVTNETEPKSDPEDVQEVDVQNVTLDEVC
jgi:hypothetical protein